MNSLLPDNGRTISSKTLFTLPLPNGEFGKFKVVESSIMEEGLAERYPEIKTYRGEGVDDKTATLRFDVTPAGFHAMILSANGTVFIDPYSRGNTEHYISYYKTDYIADESKGNIICGPVDVDPVIEQQIKNAVKQNRSKASGTELRTYRLALACTGEYTNFHGGTVAGALAGMVTTMNRVNGVYERDVAIRMVLIANNDTLIFTNSGSDPYSNNDGFAMLSQNQTTVDDRIGNANYDIGHVFSTGGGGIASLGVPCRTGMKARGVTGSFQPVGDPYDIDYVAHEMGHQWGANHPFNGTAGNCTGGNRNASTAYEPGSGSTIMAYAGICGSQNLQPNSDDHFHGISFDEIIAYSTLNSGNSCAVITSTGNTAPVVEAGTGSFTIPISTPFTLTGSATDADGDAMTYNWEEFDLGPAGHPNSPSGNAPIFRSFPSTTSPSRTFPKWSNILNNSQTIGEILPTYTRDLTFRLTVRDNNSGGGGVGFDEIAFSVSDAAGPFLVTSPNTNIGLPGNSLAEITWDVANTDAAPVNCSEVKILLSTDGGQTFPTILAANTPNDGSESVLIPDVQTSTARIKIEAVGNIFFDISNTNFQITAPVPVELTSFRGFSADKVIYLEWQTATESNNSGFSIERSADNIEFSSLGFIDGKGTTSKISSYGFTDLTAQSGIYYYRLKQIDYDGTSEYSKTIEVDFGLPKEYELMQNHPNPFNPSTTIEFSLPVEANVSITVFNTIGQEVIKIVEEDFTAGINRVSFNANKLSSGIYFYNITAKGVDGSNFATSKKMVLMK